MKNQYKPSFTLRLFAMFSLANREAVFSDVTISKKNRTFTYPCFEEEDKDLPYLGMLHPQARRFLSLSGSNSVRYFKLAEPLKDELNRAIWKTRTPKWAIQKLKTVLIEEEEGLSFTFKISAAEAYIFPTGILCLRIDIEPSVNISETNVETIGKVTINTLNRSGSALKENKFKRVHIMRLFTDQRQKESIQKRFKNKSAGIVNGLLGQEVSMGDIMEGFLTTNCKSLMGDRFLSYSFLRCRWDRQGPAFTPQNYIDLFRLSRGENDYYQPHEDACQPGRNGIINTYENVVFALSGEGVACWVKPDENQEFLQFQFKERYDTIYMYLYLLALHQRYALVHMAQALDRAVPPVDVIKQGSDPVETGGIEAIEKISEELRYLRMEVANFYLRAFFQQPAILSNHQEFYRGLQEVLGVSNLFKEVQQATSELDNLIGKFREKRAEELDKKRSSEQNEQHNDLLTKIKDLILEQEISAQNELLLTLVVEFVAIPYYLYSFLDHAIHIPKFLSVPTAVLVTLGTMGYTLYRFFKKWNEKE